MADESQNLPQSRNEMLAANANRHANNNYVLEGIVDSGNYLNMVRKAYGGEEIDSVGGTILNHNESNWRKTEQKLCNSVDADVKTGATREDAYKNMLANAKLDPDTLLNCSPAQNVAQANLGQLAPSTAQSAVTQEEVDVYLR